VGTGHSFPGVEWPISEFDQLVIVPRVIIRGGIITIPYVFMECTDGPLKDMHS
jgi:hypothetical protein